MLRKTGRDLWARKGPVLALALIMTVGIGCYVGMASVWRDMDGSRATYYRDQRLAEFTVDLKRAPAWTVAQVGRMPNVEEVQGRVSIGVRIDLPARVEPIAGQAISLPENHRGVLNDILLRSGTYFGGVSKKEVILNEAFARANNLGPGDRISVLLLDRLHELLVVGTAISPEFVYVLPPAGGLAPDPARYGIIYCREDFLQESCDLEGAYNQLVGLTHDDSDTALDNTLDAIKQKLDAFGVTNTTPRRQQSSVRFLEDELTGLQTTATIMPGIFLLVAALVMNVLVSRLVAQQRTVIGTLRAIGYSRGAISRHYLGLGVVIGGIGGVAGVVFGIYVQHWSVGIYRQFYALPRIEAAFYWDILLAGFGISVLFAVLGTLKGVRRAARLAPAEAMRPSPPESGRKVFVERITALWERLSFRWRMILRAVFRNPFRSAVTVFASVVSAALIVSALAMVDALNYLISYEFERVSRQDVTVSLRDPKDVVSTSEVNALPGISDTQPELQVVCDLSNGPYQRRLGVTGLARGSRLHTPLDGQGNPIVVPPEGLVLTKKVSEILHAGVGATLRLRPLVGRRTEREAPVVAIVETFLGLGAYADIGYLSRLLGEERSANVILVKSFRGRADESLLREMKERPAVVAIGERQRSLDQINETFGRNMITMIGIMVLFSGLVAFGSVLNAAMVSLSEREREVGTLRVLGYTPREVAGIFSGESYFLNVFGIALGLAAGVGLAHLMSVAYNVELYRFPTVIYPSRLVIAAILMCVFVAAAQLVVAGMIRKLPWLDVLKVKE